MSTFPTSFMLTSSDSENEISSNIQFGTAKIDFNKNSSPFKSSLASNLSRQTSNNSLRYFKKLKRKNNPFKSETQNKYSTTPYSSKPLKNKNSLPNSKSANDFHKIKHDFKNKNIAKFNSIDVSEEFANTLESSSDSDFPDIKFLKYISKNNEINSPSVSTDSSLNKSYYNVTNKKISTDENSNSSNENTEHHKSLNYLEFSQVNNYSVNSPTKGVYNNDLNVEVSLSDCSLSDVLFIRKDNNEINSEFYPTPDTDNSFIRKKQSSPKPLPLNMSLGFVDNDSPPYTLSDVSINLPEFIKDDIEVKQNQIMNKVEIDGQKHVLNNKYSKFRKSKSFSNEIDLNGPERSSTLLKSVKEHKSFEPDCKHCDHSCRIKNDINYPSHISETNIAKNLKKNKLKRSHKKIMTNTSDVLQVKKSIDRKKIKNNRSINKVEDIGLEYDTNKDNYMVELPNGAIVPAFLSTLKSKHVKKLCACGITLTEIPLSWSDSFHDILHQHIYKLRFKGNIPDTDSINIKQNDLSYRILICTNYYKDENIKKSIKDVDDFVSLEYGISKTSISLYKHYTYLAVLPNLKVIGYLEVEPTQEAYKLTDDEKLSEKTVPVKFGVSKIWVLIKYRNKCTVDINLLETFYRKENLQKEDVAFSLDGCHGIQFIQKFIGNTNILIYNARSA